MTLVSVIVPVYNAERHIRECLTSIQNQTLTDFELILVDDGSTDSTPAILEEFVAGEPRARIVQGPARGTAGAARNVGMAEATGDYLAFLDADDFFLPTMLEELHTKAAAVDADVVACKFFVYNDVTREVRQPEWMLLLDQLPRKQPFSARQAGAHLFTSFNPAAWNKLFRADFVRAHALQFQELRRANDAYFTYMALAFAERIACLDRHLVNYRVANSTSLQATVHENPLEFTAALEAMRTTLTEAGVWPKLERAYSQLALNMCVGNLKRQTTAEAFLEMYQALRDGVFERFGILDRPDDYFVDAKHREWRRRVLAEKPEEYLFQRALAAEGRAEKAGFDARTAFRNAAVSADPTGARTARPAVERVDLGSDDAALPDVSVIIPVYNTAMFVTQAIESVQRQSGCEIEIICVDDGSQDGSGEILDQIAAADARVRVIHQDNAGPGHARNAGLDVATGRYVCFLDSDDYWRTDALAELVRTADASTLDVLTFDAACIREPGVEDQTWSKYENYYRRNAYEGDWNGPQLMAAMQSAKQYRESACLCMARRRHIVEHGLRFPTGILQEDNLFTFALLLLAQRAGHSQTTLYSRRLRPGSIVTAGTRASAARGYFLTWVEMVRLLRGHDFGDPDVALAVGAIVQLVFSSARRAATRLPAETIARLAEVDTDADAAALFLALKRSWSDDKAKKRLERQLKSTPAPKAPPAPPKKAPAAPQKVTFARRVKRRLQRQLKELLKKK